MKMGRLNVITETGVMIAASLALSQFKLFTLPSGGSVSLGALPILLLSARHGLKNGLLSGMLVGFLSAIFKPFIVHPFQFILEYPLAHAMLGVSGVVIWDNWKKAVVVTVIAQSLKWSCHTIAGAIFFIKNEGSLYDVFIASGLYNLSYIVPETIISVLVVIHICINNKELVVNTARSD